MDGAPDFIGDREAVTHYDPIEEIVAGMPRAEDENPIETHRHLDGRTAQYYKSIDYNRGFNQAIEAQCRLLAEQGYRKVPSGVDIATWVHENHEDLFYGRTEGLHSWLMGEQKEEG